MKLARTSKGERREGTSSAGKALGREWEGDYVGTFSYFQIFGFYAETERFVLLLFLVCFCFCFLDGKLLQGCRVINMNMITTRSLRGRVININIITTRSPGSFFLFCGAKGWGVWKGQRAEPGRTGGR